MRTSYFMPQVSYAKQVSGFTSGALHIHSDMNKMSRTCGTFEITLTFGWGLCVGKT